MTGHQAYRDRSKERAIQRARRFAGLIQAAPERRAAVRRWIEARWADDPSATLALARWRVLLAETPEVICARLLDNSDAGEFLRDTIPPVFPIPAHERTAMLRASA
jgi:hypothetical protein